MRTRASGSPPTECVPGFRFVVFVNRRSKEALVPVFEARLRGSRDEERAKALGEILAIAEDRLNREAS